MKTRMSLEERRALLDSANGRFFSCEWIKKDGSLRKAVCKKWEAKYLHGKPGENVNPVAHIPKYYTICEEAVAGYRNLDLSTLKIVKINGEIYEFE